MHMARIPDVYQSPASPNETIKPFDVALSILLQIGEYFQIQDDFLDYHVPPELLGKVGTGTKATPRGGSVIADAWLRYLGQQVLLGDQHRPSSPGHYGGFRIRNASIVRAGE